MINQKENPHYYPITGILIIVQLFILNSCHKPENPEDNPLLNDKSGVYVLNEGLFDMNNCTLSFYDFSTGKVNKDIFRYVNRRGLGDTGSDLQQYGSKLYCVVNVSERLEIIDIHTGKSLKQLSFSGKQPRKIAFHDGKAYLCCYDGSIVSIDTASFVIEKRVQAGRNPEDICVANNKLYVVNSGGLDFPNYDKTVSVFDLTTFSFLKTIEVEVNPCIIKADQSGNVYVVSRGNYNDIPYTFQKIDTRQDLLVHTFDIPVWDFEISGNTAYLYSYSFTTNNSWIKVMNLDNNAIVKENFISDGTQITTPYSIAVNPVNQDVYISDSHDFMVTGDIYCFDKNGKKKYQFESGINPAYIVVKL